MILLFFPSLLRLAFYSLLFDTFCSISLFFLLVNSLLKFLDATMHLYKRLCPTGRGSDRPYSVNSLNYRIKMNENGDLHHEQMTNECLRITSFFGTPDIYSPFSGKRPNFRLILRSSVLFLILFQFLAE